MNYYRITPYYNVPPCTSRDDDDEDDYKKTSLNWLKIEYLAWGMRKHTGTLDFRVKVGMCL